MDIKKIEEQVNISLENKDIEVYSIKSKRENGMDILEILLDGNIHGDNIEEIHYLILDKINDFLPDDYYLEVSSIGAEKPIRNEIEMEKSIGKYINVVSDFYSGDGTLESFDGLNIVITVNLKGRLKKLTIPYEKINKARWAIKF